MNERSLQYNKIICFLLLNVVFAFALWWLNLLDWGWIGLLLLDTVLFMSLKKNGNTILWLVWVGALLYCLVVCWLLFFLDSQEKGITLFENWSGSFIEHLAEFPIAVAIYPYIFKATCPGSLCIIFAIFTAIYVARLLNLGRRASREARTFPWTSFLRREGIVLALLIVLHGFHGVMPGMNSWTKLKVYSKPFSHGIQNQTEADITFMLGEEQKSFPYAISFEDVLLVTTGRPQADGSRYLLLYIYPEWYPSGLATTFDDLQCLGGIVSQLQYDVAAISAENASLSKITQWFDEAASIPYGFTEYHYEMEKAVLAGNGSSAYAVLDLAEQSSAAGHPPQGLMLFSPILNLGIDPEEAVQPRIIFPNLTQIALSQKIWKANIKFPTTLLLYGEKDISSYFAQSLAEYLTMTGTLVSQECFPAMHFGFSFIPSNTDRRSLGQRNPASTAIQTYLQMLAEDVGT